MVGPIQVTFMGDVAPDGGKTLIADRVRMGHASLLGDRNEAMVPIDIIEVEVHHGGPPHTGLNQGIDDGTVPPGPGVLPEWSLDGVGMFVSPAVPALPSHGGEEICCIEETPSFR